MQLSTYPPIPESHPWHAAEEARLAAIDLWNQNRLAEAQTAFVESIKRHQGFPFLLSTFQRFVHLHAPPNPTSSNIVNVPASDLFSAFSMYLFFGRCLVARTVLEGGWSSFEAPTSLILARWLKRKSVAAFWDVGANSGFYSLLAAAIGVPEVVAFEPFAAATDLLRCNVELNRWTARVDIRQTAAADHVGQAHLYLPLQVHGLLESSASQDPTFRADHSFEFDVPCITLDSLPPDTGSLAIKIDVEGVAPTLGVLKGAMQSIQRRRPVLMVEYMEGPTDELNRFLSDTKYHSVVCRPDGSILAATGIRGFPDQPNHFLVPAELTQEFFDTISAP